MSWDGYVGNMEGEGCSYVGFFDLQGNKWAESRNPILAITPDQIKHIISAIKPPNSVDLRASGAKLGNRKFICVSQDENVVVLKQLGGDADDKLMACFGLFYQGCVVGAAPGDRLISNKVELCAIHGKNGALWASAPGFSCSPDEVVTIANAIARNDNSLYGSGAVLGGKRWTVIRLETDADLLVMKGKDTDNQKQTMIVALSTQAVIIGANKDESVQGSAVRTAVQGLRDYLKQCGY